MAALFSVGLLNDQLSGKEFLIARLPCILFVYTSFALGFGGSILDPLI